MVNHKGHPRLDIQHLEYLLRLGFSCPKIADVLGISLSTVRGRMREFELSTSGLYSSITDQELDSLVSQIRRLS